MGTWACLLKLQPQLPLTTNSKLNTPHLPPDMSCKNLNAWRRAVSLSVPLYRGSVEFKDYGYRDQLTRAVLLTVSNIAEVCGRGGCKELQRFLRYAIGPAAEVETQVTLSAEIGYIAKADSQAWVGEAQEIHATLVALIKHDATGTPRKRDLTRRTSNSKHRPVISRLASSTAR